MASNYGMIFMGIPGDRMNLMTSGLSAMPPTPGSAAGGAMRYALRYRLGWIYSIFLILVLWS